MITKFTRKTTAFTLIELLVVISIIALLVSILMPSLQKARQQAKAVVCMTHLKQLSLGLKLYTTGNDGKIMDYIFHEPCLYWYHLLAETMDMEDYAENPMENIENKGMGIMYCPSTKRPPNDGEWCKGTATMAWRDHQGYVSYKYRGEGSYGMNIWLMPKGFNETRYHIFPEENYWSPNFDTLRSSVPVFCDSVWTGNWPFDTEMPLDLVTGDPTANGLPGFCIDRHSMAVNVSFTDGRVEKVKLEKLWSLKWNRQFETTDMVDLSGLGH